MNSSLSFYSKCFFVLLSSMLMCSLSPSSRGKSPFDVFFDFSFCRTCCYRTCDWQSCRDCLGIVSWDKNRTHTQFELILEPCKWFVPAFSIFKFDTTPDILLHQSFFPVTVFLFHLVSICLFDYLETDSWRRLKTKTVSVSPLMWKLEQFTDRRRNKADGKRI